MPASLLDTIESPADLRALPAAELPGLAAEVRAFLIDSVAGTGGHLASNLGAVELTLALHYVFDTPRDRIVWDVGHQSYTHKILTGRRDAMQGLRQRGGIAGFPRRAESEFDAFGTGHSSTSISAALGMAEAFHQLGSDQRAVAVIGDGAMTAGMAFEALNNAGATELPLLVVLNDNDMSISPNVGALNNYLARLMSGRFYAAARRAGDKVLSVAPPIRELAKRAEEHMKGMVTPGTLFEEFGFNYIGPIDGHDLDVLVNTLRNIRHLRGPQFLHVVTRKGKGYTPAETNPCLYHGVARFDPAAGVAEKRAGKPSYTEVFGDWLCDMAASDPRLVGITPAMREGSGLVRFSQEFPERYFDVGIAEQHALTFAAGLACEGVKPVVAIYSTFLQRAYDQLIHDIALQNLPVTLAIDRAGLVGADGPTHAGSFDLSFLRCVPDLVIAAPSDENECRRLLSTAFLHDGPAAVRYPRGCGTGAAIEPGLEPVEIGKGVCRRRGRDVALLAFGSLVAPALTAAERLDATVADMRFVKPLDVDLVGELAAGHRLLVTLEENAVAGGAGAAVAELLAQLGIVVPVLQLGLSDVFIEHGDAAAMLAACGLDAPGIERAVSERLAALPE
ncbi:deoxyxylulose-5-phosphate synthase [Thiobacillus denitrificans ATCC 25259]|uniref:1-deoxy-D-xylulose-5-phosphate synthase n=1 Tax=Thiobacillus denitrificans (strain ATCC 25259 / T1) TaxID=292415 RepID=DXS_THIDA|nr:1-deoxy-D-xylulose-5-phosphate synthase [Thiobacillus denitrificans]Q3SKF1.1 RecName: Full=1-deoxy-D-xylulose-5-phosphate synthase; AltName: Full=1-deoxyxylulose-5-phosphate synthase; Short=DXP synthase; Short=DXPS [Thiobacillus denitrificans ATCC 25259]AAZ96832.1 deoxyxylulose-5-phosphate synthase [Thiobacillus denitrificans ATCC 25259]